MQSVTHNIKAVVLDVGEVLIELDFSDIMRLKKVEGVKNLGDWLRVMDGWDLYDGFERGHHTEAAFLKGINESLQTQYELEHFRTIWNSVLRQPVQGVENLLTETANKVPLYALTNSNVTHMDEAKRKYPLFKIMTEIFTSYELGFRKPERKIFELVTNKLNLSPSEVLFVDDRPENVEGAKSYGWNAELCARSCSKLKSIFAQYL